MGRRTGFEERDQQKPVFVPRRLPFQLRQRPANIADGSSLLANAGVNIGILGADETCCGSRAYKWIP